MPTVPPHVLLTGRQAELATEFKTPEALLAQAEKEAGGAEGDGFRGGRRVAEMIAAARALLDGALVPGTEPLTDLELATAVEKAMFNVNELVFRPYLERAAKRLRELAQGPVRGARTGEHASAFGVMLPGTARLPGVGNWGAPHEPGEVGRRPDSPCGCTGGCKASDCQNL